jgi:cystathionine gamma-lyase
MSTKKNKMGISTKAIHVGGHPDEQTGAVMPPIYQTSTYAQKSPGVHRGYEYTRTHNPTRSRLEECLAALENGKHCVVTASGLSATMLVMHMLEQGSTVLCGDDVYGGTYRMFTTVFQNFHKFHFVDTTDLKSLAAKIKKHKPALIWLETPTNPMLKISDIREICKLAKSTKAKVVVDNTFMSPCFQNPLDLGADFVMHSMTKYINGHSDVVAGCLITNHTADYEKLFKLQNSIGPSMSPFDSWLCLRGIKTLAVRMKQHELNAMAVAQYLEKHPMVAEVYYPGLKSHPGHKIAKSQNSGFGGMITFIIKGGLKEARRFLESVQIFTLAESLGGVESLIEHPAIMTHASVPKHIREELGISDGLIRLSVGIEDLDDIIADLDNAFKAASKTK